MSDIGPKTTEAMLDELADVAVKATAGEPHDGGFCQFCWDSYSLDENEETGFCWMCGTEKLVEVCNRLPALIADARLASSQSAELARLREENERLKAELSATMEQSNGQRDQLSAALADRAR